ncbi:hypothetical protein LCGC14_1636140 [marine sediment metagenome]|uniref:Uncharacterized protein n=1 Tax=marine sediment metagenome TaxID=412755 RepID=A0A0F9INE9_9ZZZZ
MADRVWLAMDTGIEHGSVCAVLKDRESAILWLEKKHRECKSDAARDDKYWRRAYAERAATETDAEMREYLEARAKHPDVTKPGEIEHLSTGFAAFNMGDYQRFYVTEHEVLTFSPLSHSTTGEDHD